jgi:tRNA A-37 threonylcarbamoyl transferase component Bud32
VNVATAEDAKFDDYIIEHVRDLNIRCVRMDFSYGDFDSHPARLLARMVAEGFDVMLNLLPPEQEARKLDSDEDALLKWRDFVEQAFSSYHDQVALFEIGNTPNRKKWSGFTLARYLPAWSVAHHLAEQYNIRLAGPNISDFEPPYNIAFLKAMSRTGKTPEVHTNNLFVERVIEPEAYDHRILGRWLTRFLGFNLIKKARVIDAIGKSFGCEKTYSTYKTWTMSRLARWSDDPEQKQADYLVRYLVLAATSGGLDRAYWGPLIDGRDGIIDDGAKGYPIVDNVAHYPIVRGNYSNLKPRLAFKALWQVVSRLQGVECLQGVSEDNGVSHFVFTGKNRHESHLCWCRDSYSFPFSMLYPELPGDTIISNVLGEQLDYVPECFSEQPLFLEFPTSAPRLATDNAGKIPDLKKTNIRMPTVPDWQFVAYQNDNWRGAVAVKNKQTLGEALLNLLPASLHQAAVDQVLRDSRNLVWRIDTGTHGKITIKLNKVSKRRKIAYRFRDSKARRHWNNASMMLRKGVKTPMPIAFFERHQLSGIQDSYYVCAYLEETFSARDVFASINNGEESFRSMAHQELLEIIAKFICHMHNMGILHRDLSSGNILMTKDADGLVTPYLIDIGRARTGLRLTPRLRMVDLMRMHYKLTWPDREKFMGYYDKHLGRPVAWWWRYAVKYYEGKQKSKRAVKGRIMRLIKGRKDPVK